MIVSIKKMGFIKMLGILVGSLLLLFVSSSNTFVGVKAKNNDNDSITNEGGVLFTATAIRLSTVFRIQLSIKTSI